MKLLNQAGDTIVEVLLALTVLATVVGSAYAIASRSLVGAQQAQERVAATKLAEGQIERLKYLAENNKPQFTTLKSTSFASGTWCINSSFVLVNTCLDSSLFTYQISNFDSSKNQFTIYVSWGSFHSGTDSVTMLYRIQD